MVEILDVVEHEDGSATYSVDLTDEEKDTFAQAGFRLAIMLAAFQITEKELFEILVENKNKEN